MNAPAFAFAGVATPAPWEETIAGAITDALHVAINTEDVDLPLVARRFRDALRLANVELVLVTPGDQARQSTNTVNMTVHTQVLTERNALRAELLVRTQGDPVAHVETQLGMARRTVLAMKDDVARIAFAHAAEIRARDAEIERLRGVVAAGAELIANQGTEIDNLACHAAALARLLREAAGQFRFYEASHRAKGTPDGDDKAAVNKQWADRLDAEAPIIAEPEGR